MWKLHLDLLAFSNRHDVIDIFPNNSYNYSGVEMLLKGTGIFKLESESQSAAASGSLCP